MDALKRFRELLLGVGLGADLDIDGTLAANSDELVPSQKAVRTALACIHRSSVAASEVSGTTETTVATITVPVLGANDEVQFEAVLTRTGLIDNALLNVYLDGNLIAVHKLGIDPFALLPLQHLFSNRNDDAIQLGGCDSDGALLTGTADTSATSTLVFKLQNGDAGDATTLESLTVKRIQG